MSSWSPASGGWSSYVPSRQGVASTVSGLGGVASGVYGAVSNSVPSGQGYLSSLPAGLKRLSDLLPTGDGPEHGLGDRDEVVTVSFDVDTGPARHLHFLNVCFRNGFQIWEVLDSDEHGTQATRETQPLREVVSVRQGYTQFVKVLSTVPVVEESPLHGKQPAVAVVAGDEPGDLNVVRFFSLRENEYVHHIRFHGDVHAATCNRHSFIVCLKNQLILHRMSDLTQVQTLSTFPSPTPQGVLALGPRWLAYASNQPLRTAPDGDGNTDPSNTYGSAYLDLGVAAASTAASGAMHLGGLGLRTLNSYLGSSPPIAQTPDQPGEYAGTVMVRDLQNQSVVHHFKAHEGPVSIIRFDPSGLLLATAAVDGHNINVFQVDASHLHGKTKSSGPRAPRHLYKLVRGMTSAIIDDLSFSMDTRWISVTTRSRTAHLYAINGDGSHATIETHVPSPSIDAAWPQYPSSEPYAASGHTPITLFAVQRIKQREHLPAGVMSRTLAPTGNALSKGVGLGSLASSCTRFLIPGNTTSFSQFPAASSGIFMVTGEGVGVVLATYQLSPYCKEDPDTLAQTMHLDADCQGTMDICRRRSWRAQECNAQRLSSWTRAAEENANAEEAGDGTVMPAWVSNVEIYTHERSDDATWASRNFSFKSFKKCDAPPADGPTAFMEQLETVVVGGRSFEMDGGEDPDEEEYFFVQGPVPRTGPTISPHTFPMCPPPPPDVLHLQPDSSPGVYGGLPSSFGSSQGTPPIHENRVHAQGREPAGARSYGSSMRGTQDAGRISGQRIDGSDEDSFGGGKGVKVAVDGFQKEEGLFDMDTPSPRTGDAGWDSEGGSGGDSPHKAAGTRSEQGMAGLAASSMLFDDDELGGGDDFLSLGAGSGKESRGCVKRDSVAGGVARTKNAIESLGPASSLGAAAAGAAGSRKAWEDGLGDVEDREKEVDMGERDEKSSPSGTADAGGWDSDAPLDRYDGDRSAKGDNDTPMNSFSPSGGLQALENMKNLRLQMHPDSGSKHASDVEDWDSWGEPAGGAAMCSPKKPPRSPKTVVSKLGEEEEEEEAAASKGESKDDGKGSASAPELSSDAEGLSSGMESENKESGQESPPTSSSAKKKKKKKSKK